MSTKIRIVWRDDKIGEVATFPDSVVLSDNKNNVVMYKRDTFEKIIIAYAKLVASELAERG